MNPMQNKVTVRRVRDVFVISDEGLVSKALGMEPAEWHQIAPTAELIGDRVERMERLIAAALERAGTKVDMPRVLADNPATDVTAVIQRERAAVSLDDLDTLGLKPQNLWRLRKALKPHGIVSVAQLAGCTEDFLGSQKGIGPSIVKAIKKALKAKGIRLAAKVGKTMA